MEIVSKSTPDRHKMDLNSLGGSPGALRGHQGRSGELPGGPPGSPEALAERPEGSHTHTQEAFIPHSSAIDLRGL